MGGFGRGCVAVVGVVVLAATLGCGSGVEQPSGYDPSTRPTGEAAQSVTTMGDRTVSLWTFPQPPRKGTNDVVFRITDVAGAPVDGFTIEATPWMPAHGHGTAATPIVTAQGDGWYWASPVYLYMSGRWELRLRLSGPVDTTSPDSATPTFDIP